MSSTPFFQRIEQRAKEINSLLCIGLDPHDIDPEIRKIKPALSIGYAWGLAQWGLDIIAQTADLAVCYKLNSAFYEAYGPAGLWALEELVAQVRKLGIPVIVDCKRADVGTTADYYAQAAFTAMGADAITMLPYLGLEIVNDLIPKDKAGFVVCRTTNKSLFGSIQDQRLYSGHKVYTQIAMYASELHQEGYPLGLVMGAQDTQALRNVRNIERDMWFLTPGIGAQGGNLQEALLAGIREDGLGMLFSVSRGITHQDETPRERAEFYTEAIRSV